MRFNSKIKGYTKMVNNLNKEIMNIQGRTTRGLVLAAILVYRETEKGAIVTPLDYGNLRASFFIVTRKSVPRGSGTARFNGPKGARISAEHVSSIPEFQQKCIDNKKAQMIILGYTANYATYVHEAYGHKFKQRRGKMAGRSGPGWFRAAFEAKKPEMLAVIAANTKIKP
jgi:hypothetical protein